MDKVNKHRKIADIQFFDFSGGLNYLLSADMLQSNETVAMDNMIFDPSSGLAVTRPVFNKIADMPDIKGAYIGESALLVSAAGKLYKNTDAETVIIGDIEGDTAKFAEWDGGYVIATGSKKIYFMKNGALTAIEPKTPEGTFITPTNVFVRMGRVVIYRENTDTLYYSSVGELKWEYGELKSDAKYIETGYKDSGDIAAVVPLSQDIAIFKTNGIVYRLAGEYPDWTIYEVARNVFCKYAAIQNMNSVIFMTENGLMSLDTVQQYGDIAIGKNLSRKIDPVTNVIYKSKRAGLFALPSIHSIILSDPLLKDCFVMSLSNGAFTKWRLPMTITCAGEHDGKIYLTSKDALYQASYGDIEDGRQITSRLISKTYYNQYRWLIKKVTVFIDSAKSGVLNIKLGKLEYSVTRKPHPIAFLDSVIAFLNDSPVVPSGWEVNKFGDVWSNNMFNCIINIKGRGAAKVEVQTAVIGNVGDTNEK